MTDTQKLDLILSKLESVDQRLDGMDQRLDRIDQRLDNHDRRFERLEKDVKDIKLTLENEIRVNIQRIAEGHLDLSRKLNEAMKPSNEVEMLSIRVRMLETDVRELKCKVL